MEPNRVIDPQILAVLNNSNNVNRSFIVESSELPADFERMMDPGFSEVGASGRRYSRQHVLDDLERRYAENSEPDDWQTRDFDCRQIAVNNYLLTYTLIQGTRITCRATIWRQTRDGWKIVYHQGTVVQDQMK